MTAKHEGLQKRRTSSRVGRSKPDSGSRDYLWVEKGHVIPAAYPVKLACTSLSALSSLEAAK